MAGISKECGLSEEALAERFDALLREHWLKIPRTAIGEEKCVCGASSPSHRLHVARVLAWEVMLAAAVAMAEAGEDRG